MTRKSILPLFLLSAALRLAPCPVLGFLATSPQRTRSLVAPSLLSLEAKKKKGNQGGKGFGKAADPTTATTSEKQPTISDGTPTTASPQDNSPQGSFLQSVEKGGSSSIPTMEPDLPPEERAKKLLREQYGLRTMEEQRMEDARQEQKARFEEMKELADKDVDFDIMATLPAPLLKGIDTFLKLGVAICTVLFVTAGIGITAEAWSKTSGNPLPDNIDAYIVNVVEPNFTPGLLVLLGFSVSLGGFAALQLSSASSQYKEE